MPRHVGLAPEPSVEAPPNAVIVRAAECSVGSKRGPRQYFPNLWAAHKAAEDLARERGRPLFIIGLPERESRPATHYGWRSRNRDLHWFPDSEE
jgi:hypothetical protein